MSGGRRQDAFGKRAKAEGYPARSVYKLEEIDKRVRLLRPGLRVLDLGAAPGSWSLYAARKVGRKGVVVAIDLQRITIAFPPQVEVLEADATDVLTDEPPAWAIEPFDLVLSDMAPATTGQRQLDMYRSYELVMTALRIGTEVLRPGGSLVAKIFQGAEFEDARSAFREVFADVRTLRPKAIRSESYEVFLVGQNRRSKPR
ncbi:MAG: RlmE family RNA methyltransferase [Myxococcota bacterium]